jgi:hypothetical protein
MTEKEMSQEFHSGDRFHLTQERILNYVVGFHAKDGSTVGELDFNTGKLIFTGNADESAKIFIDALGRWFEIRLKQERQATIQECIDIVARNGGSVEIEAEIRSLEEE